MKARLVPVALLPVTLGSLVVAAIACGGSSSPSPTGGSGNTDASSTSTPDSSSSGVDSSSGNGGNGNDANAPGSGDANGSKSDTDAGGVPDGGAAVTPGVVQCGGTDCNVDQSTCCVAPDGGASCVTGTSTQCPTDEATIHCLEAPDCTGSNVCCGTFSFSASGAVATTTCGAGPCSTVQFCRTSGECLNSQPCVVQKCAGQVLELCGLQSQFGCTAD